MLWETQRLNLHHVYSSHITTPPRMAFGSTGCTATFLSYSHLKQWNPRLHPGYPGHWSPPVKPRTTFNSGFAHITELQAEPWPGCTLCSSLSCLMLPALGSLTGLEQDELSFTLLLNLSRKKISMSTHFTTMNPAWLQSKPGFSSS